MKLTSHVFLFAVLATTSLPCANAQVPSMQKGISVELPVTHHAVAMPDADREDALVVSITAEGKVYYGVDAVSPADLAAKIREQWAKNPTSKVYIKADARAVYGNVAGVLAALRAAGVTAPVFLAAQRDSSDVGPLVPPKGWEVLTAASGVESVMVQVRDSGSESPVLMVDGERVFWSALQNTLEQRFQKQSKEVQVQADGKLPFVHVVRVMDMCRSAGANVIAVAPAL